MTPSLCRLREAPSHLSCDTVFPIPCYQILAVLPPTKKIPRLRFRWRYEKNAFPTYSFFAWCTRYPFPTLSFRAQREIFFVPFFPPPSLSRLREAPLPPFRDTVFPVFRYRTLALLPPTKKIPRLRSGWRYGKNAFPTHSLYDARGIHSPHDHFERSEKWGFGKNIFPAHTLYDTADIHSPTLSFRAQREIFFVPFFHDSFAKPFTGSTAYRLSCDTVFPISRCQTRSLLPPTKKILRLCFRWRYVGYPPTT